MRTFAAASFAGVFALVLILTGCTPKKTIHIHDFTTALAAKGLIVEGQHEMLSAIVSAHDGASLQIAGGVIEVYDYDLTIKSGREAHDKFATEGYMGQKMVSNANLLLMEDTKNPRWVEIKQVFDSL